MKPVMKVRVLFCAILTFGDSCSNPVKTNGAMASTEAYTMKAASPADLIQNAIYVSTDFGTTWNNFGNGLPREVQVTSIVQLGNELALATDNAGLFISEQNKTKWRQAGEELSNKKINALHISGDDIFAGVYRHGIYSRKVREVTWYPMNYNLPDLRVNGILKTNGILFVGTDLGIFKFIDALKVWRKVFGDVQVVSLNQGNGKIVAGTSQGTLSSDDGGEHWKWIHRPEAAHNTAILKERIVIMNISGDLLVSDDGGKNWFNADYSPRIGSYVYEVAQVGDYLIASNNYGIHRSADGGKNWKHVYKTEELVFFDFLVVDNVIYAGTRMWKEYRKK